MSNFQVAILFGVFAWVIAILFVLTIVSINGSDMSAAEQADEDADAIRAARGDRS
jgi:hypothetical protein